LQALNRTPQAARKAPTSSRAGVEPAERPALSESLERVNDAAKAGLYSVNDAAKAGLYSVNGAVGAGMTAGMMRVAVQPDNQQADPQWLRGALYAVYPSSEGKATLLRQSGETHPQGLDVPDDCVKNNLVVLLTEGIGDNIPGYARETYELLQSNSKPWSMDLGQPILAVHEGTEGKTGRDVKRIARDGQIAKRLELGRKVDVDKIYQHDPAIKTLVDVIGQQLDAGHDLLLVPHSGGGPENAVALNLLAQQGYQDKIHDHVRVLSLAGAAAPQDYVMAGVDEKNIYHTANHQDVVGQVGSIYMDPKHPSTFLRVASVVAKHAREKTPRHNNGFVFEDNLQNGHNYIKEFVEGGEGGIRIL
jgi:hypothetical protein